MNKEGEKQQTLADIIMEKIAEKETEVASQFSGLWIAFQAY